MILNTPEESFTRLEASNRVEELIISSATGISASSNSEQLKDIATGLLPLPVPLQRDLARQAAAR